MSAGGQPGTWTTTPKGARLAKVIIAVVLITVFLCGAGSAAFALLLAWLTVGHP